MHLLYRFMLLTLLLGFTCHLTNSQPFLPILVMHGIGADAQEYNPFADIIRDNSPNGTFVMSINSMGIISSITTGMNYQLKDLADKIHEIKQKYGIKEHHLVCHSQGALLCRSYLQTYSDHSVKVFISLTGPHNGQFGIPNVYEWEQQIGKYIPNFLNISRNEAYLLFYNKISQETISIAGYWKDPYHIKEYKAKSKFLSIVNNETFVDYAELYNFKNNFLKIDKLVLTGSPGDEIITPYQSAFFGCFDENEKIIPMKEQSFYLQDSFGLQTLESQNRLIKIEVPNVKHLDWISYSNYFIKFMKPYLY
ncbi:hypothetical protein ABK040_004489 [Willaertia magna]